MAYIGNQPTEAFTTFATQTFSTSATSSYTLDHAVTNENEIALFVNNVRQQPGSGKAYTATGTALTLSANTASTDTMYCVFLGRALQTVNPPAGSVGSSQIAAEMITGTTALAAEPADTDEFLISDAGTLKRLDYSFIKDSGGITEADQWRLTSNASCSTSATIITANLERVDTAPQGYLAGSGMSQSSGVFTFPSTGIWLVESTLQFSMSANNNRYLQSHIQGTTDNFSSVDNRILEATSNTSDVSGTNYVDVHGSTLIDCTDTSNVKVKFGHQVASTGGSEVLYASTTANRTYFTFIRLGDT
jgi:hypothetical protein